MRHRLFIPAATALLFALAACTQDELAGDNRLPKGECPVVIRATGLSVEATPLAAPSTRASVDGDWQGVTSVALKMGDAVKEYNKQDKSKRRVCHCEDPCTTSSCGRMFYIYPEKDFRAYPGTARGTEEWDSTYKIRVNVEKSINHFKDSFCIAGRKTQNEKTLHADLLLAGITQLITVMVADKINKHQ